MGGQWVGPTQDVVLDLIDELGLETFRSYDDGEAVTVLTERRAGPLRRRDLRPRRWRPRWRSVGCRPRSSALARDRRRSRRPGTHPTPRSSTGQTLDAWLTAEHLGPAGRSDFLRLLVPALCSAEAAEMSFLHFLRFVQGGNGPGDRLVSTTGGAQESRIVGGSAPDLGADGRPSSATGSVLDAVVRTDHARTRTACGSRSSVARSLAQPSHRRRSHRRLAGRVRTTCRRSQPGATRLTQQVPAGHGDQGARSPTTRRSGARHGPQRSFALRALEDEFNVVLRQLPARRARCRRAASGSSRDAHARTPVSCTPTSSGAQAWSTLGWKYFGPQAAGMPVRLPREGLGPRRSSPAGRYGGRLGAGVWTQFGKALAEPIGRIHWAGSESAEVWNNYMDGAIKLRPSRRHFEALAALIGA